MCFYGMGGWKAALTGSLESLSYKRVQRCNQKAGN